MAVPINPTSDVSPNMRGFEMGAFITRGGAISLDTYINGGDTIFKVLMATTGGLAVVEGIDGNPIPVMIQDNGGIPVLGRRVLTTGGGWTTTASGMYWGGGT